MPYQGVGAKKSADSEDDVLITKYASSLDLDETDLAVLKACEADLDEVERSMRRCIWFAERLLKLK